MISMNILFLLKSYCIGGLEVVTTVLANKFHMEGHNVTLWAFKEGDTSLRNQLNPNIKLIYGNGFSVSKFNIQSLRNILVDNKIDIVINQWGLPFIPALVLNKASKGLDIKKLAVYHSAPASNGKIMYVESEISLTKNKLKRYFLYKKLCLYKQITAASMRYVYYNSHHYLVLSSSFVDEFKKFTGLKNSSKLLVQTNPITIETSFNNHCIDKKEKEVVFVGRFDMIQKRIDRIINVWRLIENDFPDWTLRLVGDGKDRSIVEDIIKDYNLKNVSIEGFQNPIPYYVRSRVLLLTSEFEGFGLTVIEGMSYGVVPIVLGSYTAIFDIIHNNQDGFIVPYNKKDGFNAEYMADKLKTLMSNESLYREMAGKAIMSSKSFSIDKIYKSWQNIFDNL